MAVNQKAIGCKLEIRVLEKLEDYCAKYNLKNHRIMAVNQKAIGCKLEIRVLEKLEDYCTKYNLKKNAVINLAIEYYIDHV